MSTTRPRSILGHSMIDDRQFQAHQSWNRITIFSTPQNIFRHKLRVTIRYNAYAFQSKGLVERWDGDRWREVASIPYSQLAGVRDQVNYTQSDPPASSFNEDETELLSLATAILN